MLFLVTSKEHAMHAGKIVFAQLMECLPWYQFNECVRRYQGDYRMRHFSCLSQFYCMAFAQLTGRESLRDIVTCLMAHGHKLYHMGIRGPVRKSTLADANEHRDWRVFADLARELIAIARRLYVNEDLGVDVTEPVFAFDSTLIDLCLTLFPWATFRTTTSAVKMHTLLDLRGAIPACIWVTEGSVHDVTMLDVLSPLPQAVYVMDRGYMDFERLYRIHRAGAHFIIRAKHNLACKRIGARPLNRATGVRGDQTILLTSPPSRRAYPEPLRKVTVFDAKRNKFVAFLTNYFGLPAVTVADLYRKRWDIEIFFRWVKQHLRIKRFFGTSPNAVKTQLWIAIATYVLVAIFKKRLGLPVSLYTLLQYLSVSVFEQVSIAEALTHISANQNERNVVNQLNLPNL
jgi:hypothetical protein